MPLIGCQHQGFFLYLVAAELAGFDSVGEYHYTVRDGDDFLKLRGNDDNEKPLLRILVDDIKHLGLGSDINASAGLIHQKDLRVGENTLSDNNLLLIAAGQGKNWKTFVRHLNMDIPDLFLYLLIFLVEVSAPMIKCKKTPKKKCRFMAERRKKR